MAMSRFIGCTGAGRPLSPDLILLMRSTAHWASIGLMALCDVRAGRFRTKASGGIWCPRAAQTSSCWSIVRGTASLGNFLPVMRPAMALGSVSSWAWRKEWMISRESRAGGVVPFTIHSKTCHRSESFSADGWALQRRSRCDQPDLVRYLTAWKATAAASLLVYQFVTARRRPRPQRLMEST